MADTTTFSEDEFPRLIEAYAELQKFTNFVLERFKTHEAVTNQRDIDAELRQAGGYKTITVDQHTLFDPTRESVTIYEKMNDDRFGKSTQMPKAFIFKTTEQEEDYANYLALRTKIFGGGAA